jgi:hypothetical protein
MSLYIPEGTPPIVSGSMAQIQRLLPHPGEVVVREGSRVESEDVVARAYLPAPTQVINVAQALAIPPSQVERAMLCRAGESVEKHEIIAQVGPFGGRRCLAPTGGVIGALDSETGYITLSPDPIEHTLFANVRGVVMHVYPHRGVIIETPADLIYGAFGIGEERSGVLQLIATDPDEVITHDMISARNAYAILIGGGSITAAALKRAVKAQVRGIVVGGIDEQEFRAFVGWATRSSWKLEGTSWQFPSPHRLPDLGLTLLVTEGFGVHPMSTPIFDLLSSRNQQEALIEGSTILRKELSRPRLVVAISRGDQEDDELPKPQIQPGSTVRLLDAAHLGAVATVRRVFSTPIRITTGIRTPAVEVVTEAMAGFDTSQAGQIGRANQANQANQSLLLPQSAVEVLS